MKNPLVKWSVILILLSAVVIAFAMYIKPRHDDQNEYVLRLKWLHQAQFAGFYQAQDDKLYEGAGLKIRIEQGGPDFPAVKMVASGNETFGVAGADQVLLARSQGVPIVPLLIVYRESPFILFSPTKQGIRSPEDLVSRKVGVKRGGNEELIYRALLARSGAKVPTGSEIPVQFDLAPFLAGKVDVWPGYAINEPLAAVKKGIEVSIMKPSDFGISLYADTVFTTERMIKENPESVKRFVAATLEGWRRAVAKPENAGQISLKYAMQSDLGHQTAMMRASLPYIDPDGKGVGFMTLDGWERTQKLLVDGGFLKKPVDLNAMLTAAKNAGAPVQ